MTIFSLTTCLGWSRKQFITHTCKKYAFCIETQHVVPQWVVVLQLKQITQQQSFALLDSTGGDSAPLLKAA